MKYIRLEDGVYDLLRNIRTNNFYIRIEYDDGYSNPRHLSPKDLKKYRQADTVEELCDEFIFIGEDNKPRLTYKAHEWLVSQFKGRMLYGAIWVTDEHGAPILKPVAEMNKEGEFELL